jgi:hypothetical protein
MNYTALSVGVAIVLAGCGGVAADEPDAVRKYLFPSPTATLTPNEEAAALYYQFQLQNQLLDLQPQGLAPPSAAQQRQRLETGIELNRMDGLITNNRFGN